MVKQALVAPLTREKVDLVRKDARKCRKQKEVLCKLQNNPDAPNKGVIQSGIKELESVPIIQSNKTYPDNLLGNGSIPQF